MVDGLPSFSTVAYYKLLGEASADSPKLTKHMDFNAIR